MSVILNTTFVVHSSVKTVFLGWLESVYLPAVKAPGVFGEPTVARVMTQIEPDTESIAVQMRAAGLAEAERWHDETAALLKDDLIARWPERVMHFTTYMEVLDL